MDYKKIRRDSLTGEIPEIKPNKVIEYKVYHPMTPTEDEKQYFDAKKRLDSCETINRGRQLNRSRSLPNSQDLLARSDSSDIFQPWWEKAKRGGNSNG